MGAGDSAPCLPASASSAGEMGRRRSHPGAAPGSWAFSEGASWEEESFLSARLAGVRSRPRHGVQSAVPSICMKAN